MPKQDDLIRLSGAAALAGVSVATVRRWITEGKLVKYQDARRRVWVDRKQVLGLNRPTPVVTGSGR
jgi:predicted site-specific integrase-resolvase